MGSRQRFYSALLVGLALAIGGGYLAIAQPWIARPVGPTPIPFEAMPGYVSRSTVASWPLTVDDGLLKCGRAQAVTLTTRDARTYAVNLPAKSQGIAPIDELLTAEATDADLYPLIDAGLTRCP